ncbi:PTS sugar transporter subunit IIA [Halanaerobium hydrogeniformans]|uniref:PTS IIA-like nitrogen-regulatory protein PtsN n=1 Tax=Halanaerobium hydrogeniformans TaxID=656519 RepID=E4RM20_HALHG|nr:PTS sugar transporter subunit IIA [Halanaerobium hydrogeniformans]ADQ14103.1 putative PTS IIA-like nitrogen-regulatory protein PtsN [Halanaerobium hydrogeniformans]
MDEIHIDDDLIEMDLKVDSKKEVIKKLNKKMLKKEIVKESYLDAVLKREEEFPTALSTENINFAIPHTDPKHVNRAALAIALLKNKVNFISMENYDKEIEVEIVFLLAIKDPSKQVKVLQKLMEIMQSKVIVDKILTAENQSKLVDIFEKRLKI